MTVAVLGTMRVSPEAAKTLLPALKTLVDATRRDDGCIAYDVGLDPFEPGLFRFSELWPDQASLTAHISAAHIAPWRAAIQAAGGVIERNFTIYDASNARPL